MTDATTGPSHPPETPPRRAGSFLALYKRMRTAGQLRRYLLVEYRCVHRAACLLARVHATPHGFMLYRAAHTFSTTTTTPPMPLAGKSRAETAELLPDPPCSVHLGCDHGRFDRPPRARPQLPETAAGSPEARFVGGSQSLSATMAEHLGGAPRRSATALAVTDLRFGHLQVAGGVIVRAARQGWYGGPA